ncbi:hypothetical protein IWW39_006243 [Coemansia spiralis]|uniref:NTF2 domain-containing protein n=1 Tax=Coemansia spiralis TaxID=417178 RepID=A0A9W8GD19_9FUNG|nr:hypothetical protein IWW39_006243 [Coemansia spiralis]
MSFSQQAIPSDGAAGTETRMVVIQEIGWMFAQEYYTIMNSDPKILHMFYGRKSTCIHGTEGEVVKQTNGQQDIEALIASEGFKDCKVLVANVDTLPSVDGSIVVQVIGEMSNNGQPSRRFAQTFLLVEQPGGYYLHNDILRYLKDDLEEREPATAPTSASVVEAEVPAATASLETDSVAVPEVVVCPKKDEKVDVDEPIKQADVPSAAAAAEVVAEVHTPVAEIKAAVAEEIAAPVAPEAAVTSAPSNTKSEPKPRTPREKPAASEAPKAEKPVAPVPSKPTSWANLAANDSSKWGNTISKVGGTVAPATVASGAGTGAAAGSDPSSRVSTPASGAREPRRKDVFSVFFKNIPRGTPMNAIKFACRGFGQLVFVDYIPTKTTAVVDFGTEAARQAALSAGTVMVSGSIVAIEERRNRQPSGRRDETPAGAAKQQQQPAAAATQSGSGAAPQRNGSGEFERVGSSRGSRSRAANSGGSNASNQGSGSGAGANRSRAGKQ